jgi:hypothetical protein
MAYAELVFSSTPAAGQVMKSIIKVLTGETNLANLDGVVTAGRSDTAGFYKSEIKNANNETWTLEYPTSLPADTAINTFTVSKTCIDNTKKKFVRFIVSSSVGLFTEPINTGVSNHSLTTSYCIQVQGLSAINTSTGATTNLTYRNNNGAFATIKKATSTTENYVVWLSWSNRHLFVMSNVGGRTCFHSSMEFDENNVTQFSNAAPVLHITGGGATTTLTNQTTATTTSVNVVSILNMYNPADGTTPGVRCLTNTTNSASFNSNFVFGLASGTDIEDILLRRFYDPTTTKNKWQPSPIFIDDTANGNGIIDLSKYSNMYLFLNGSFEGSIWRDSNGVDYKSLHIYNSGLTDFSVILVKYG